MKKVLVTGATGFVGQYLCSYLETSRHDVFGTYLLKHEISPKITHPLHFLDITDALSCRQLIRKLQPDHVIHLAALAHPRTCQMNPSKAFEINVGGTLNLLDALRTEAPKAKMLFISSSYVYGRSLRQGKPVCEETLPQATNVYAFSKLTAELACRDYATRFGIHAIIARPFNHIGKGQSTEYVFADWADQIAQAESNPRSKKCILQVGNLKIAREFLPVEDVIEAYAFLLRKGKAGQVYNICAGRPRKLSEYARRLCNEARIPVEIRVDPAKCRQEVPVASGCPDKLTSLGWVSKRNAFDLLPGILEEARSRHTRD